MPAENFVNDPCAAEFYPRRIYANCGSDFAIVNNAAAPAWRDWDQTTGIDGLSASLRKWQQPHDAGSDSQVRDIAQQMVDLATQHGHIQALA
jgi:hypothetical protein